MNNEFINKSSTVNFSDVAHGTLIFDRNNPWDALALELIDTAWVQRLRRISQTGNTKFVYMFAEHSRFGHSLGVAFLALQMLKHLSTQRPELVKEWAPAIAAAAVLHDIGHVSPGSHLAEAVWSNRNKNKLHHEDLTMRVIREDKEISSILEKTEIGLTEKVIKILDEDSSIPNWATSLISGGGWNVDRGNWSIVDSVMCAVTYGRYNVTALIDAFRLTEEGTLAIQESRLDALTHFFVARNSMYRQVYQHRVLQATDAVSKILVRRIRDLAGKDLNLFLDPVMEKILNSNNPYQDMTLEELFKIDENWWGYHLSLWASDSNDSIVKDLSKRLLNRILPKTIHLELNKEGEYTEAAKATLKEAKKCLESLGFDPEYYLIEVNEKDSHRNTPETPPMVLRESGELIEVKEIEPLVVLLNDKSKSARAWLAVPKEVKQKLGRDR